jgi:hypothetical protein
MKNVWLKKDIWVFINETVGSASTRIMRRDFAGGRCGNLEIYLENGAYVLDWAKKTPYNTAGQGKIVFFNSRTKEKVEEHSIKFRMYGWHTDHVHDYSCVILDVEDLDLIQSKYF